MAEEKNQNKQKIKKPLFMLPSPSNLISLKQYLKRYSKCQPAAFEYLIGSVFSQILYLPFHSKDSEDNTVTHRVIWYGSINKRNKTISKSPFGPDSVCFAYGFYLLIESTLRDGANQWRKEFVESLTHYDNFITNKNVDKKDVYVVLVAPRLHRDTYTGFKQKANEGCNILVLESSCLAKIGDTTKIIPTVRHLDLRHLFNDMVRTLRDSTSFDRFRGDLNKSISGWQKDVLKRERTVFFGLRAYEAIKKAGRNIVGTSDILLKLHRDSKFNHYIKILGGGDLTTYIREGLLTERLAHLISTPSEDVFCRIHSADFRARGLRLIRAVEDVNV